MSGRTWLLLVVIFVAVMAGFWYATAPDSGEVEFGKAKEAVQSVKGWKMTELPQSGDVFRKGGSWAVDCATAQPPAAPDWGSGEFLSNDYSPEPDFAATCSAIAKGGTGYPFPDFGVLQSQAVIRSKGTKKVNGVKCRQWLVEIVKIGRRQNLMVCLGTKDHLPYETTGDYEPHLTFSDYVLAQK